MLAPRSFAFPFELCALLAPIVIEVSHITITCNLETLWEMFSNFTIVCGWSLFHASGLNFVALIPSAPLLVLC